jgi:hypothetical protein
MTQNGPFLGNFSRHKFLNPFLIGVIFLKNIVNSEAAE